MGEQEINDKPRQRFTRCPPSQKPTDPRVRPRPSESQPERFLTTLKRPASFIPPKMRPSQERFVPVTSRRKGLEKERLGRNCDLLRVLLESAIRIALRPFGETGKWEKTYTQQIANIQHRSARLSEPLLLAHLSPPVPFSSSSLAVSVASVSSS